MEGAGSAGVGYITDYHLPMDWQTFGAGLAINKDVVPKIARSFPNNPSQDNPAPGYYWWNTLTNNTTFTQNQLLGSVKLTADILPWLSIMGHTRD